ncbi:MAG: minor capsid protein [Clostridium sp.]|jgi:SPP1 gp7 family putative phage head morphogenesis protein|uniref:minor capsid protein n=1 Tax=Clostridium sp. TaxID=1506 RepID=UPI0025B8FEBE|nr:minor capsid protein [Clostridium sp.]MCH3962681.1 minor capsid protein [Clostridium sp.]MCI2201066.1 minor capsid protein [Clostridium sp.]
MAKVDPQYRRAIEQIRLDSEKYADEQMKDMYSDQKDKLNELHSFIGMMYIKYSIDGLLKLNKAQRVSITSALDSKLKSIGKSLGQKEVSKIKSILSETYKDTYYKNAYVLDKGMDVNIKFKMLKQEFIDSAVNAKFKSLTFSDRIWNNKADMIDKLKKSLVEAYKGNIAIDKIAKDVQHTFNVSAYDSNRLVATETARVAVKAQEQIGIDSGCKEVMWSATLDHRTAPYDASLDGKVWRINESHPEPVMDTHPRCRCVLINVPFEGWKPTKRKDNETKEIIDYMDYEQWLKEKVGISKSSDANSKNNDIINNTETFGALDLNEKAVKSLKAIHAELNEYSRTNHKEKLVAMSIKDGLKRQELTGNGNSVVFTSELINFLNNSEANSVMLVHNHPGSSSFSDADLKVMVNFNSINGITVEGQNGTKYICKIGDGIIPDNLSQITEDFNEIKNELFDDYRAKVLTDEMTPDEAWYEHSNEVMERLAHKYNWIYRRIEPNEK